MSTPLDAIKAHIDILVHCRNKQAELGQMIEKSRAAIEEALGDDEIGTLNGEPVIRWRHQKVTHLDQKALKEAHPEIVAEFQTTSTQRRFEILNG